MPQLCRTPAAQEVLVTIVRAHERERAASLRPIDGWTLTWLEGRPRLQLGSGPTLTLSDDDSPVWEERSGKPEDGASVAAEASSEHEDDDDWLSG